MWLTFSPCSGVNRLSGILFLEWFFGMSRERVREPLGAAPISSFGCED